MTQPDRRLEAHKNCVVRTQINEFCTVLGGPPDRPHWRRFAIGRPGACRVPVTDRSTHPVRDAPQLLPGEASPADLFHLPQQERWRLQQCELPTAASDAF